MKLTKDDFEIVNIDRPDHGIRYLYFHTKDGFSKEKCEQLKQQILDDNRIAEQLRELRNHDSFPYWNQNYLNLVIRKIIDGEE